MNIVSFGKIYLGTCPLPKGRKLVKCKWVYRNKYASNESVDKHKAQLVSNGFS